MRPIVRTLGCVAILQFAAVVVAAQPGVAASDYASAVTAARLNRVQRLTTPTGWLSLIGLHFLPPGPTSIGSAAGNAIVLPKGPAYVGTLTLSSGRATITLNPAAGAHVDGRQVLSAELDSPSDESGPPVVTCGTISFLVIERGGRKALRVKDSESDRLVHFAGLDYFPIDPTWRIEAEWVPFEQPRSVIFQNILGQESSALVPGQAVFTRDGKTCVLLPLVEGADEPLLFVIADETSGRETYAAARFVYADPPRDGKIVLDFNEAMNPPCAFTPFATCPLPPRQNRLPLAIRAGEKQVRGSHDEPGHTPVAQADAQSSRPQ